MSHINYSNLKGFTTDCFFGSGFGDTTLYFYNYGSYSEEVGCGSGYSSCSGCEGFNGNGTGYGYDYGFHYGHANGNGSGFGEGNYKGDGYYGSIEERNLIF